MDASRSPAHWLQAGWREVVARVAPINCVGCGIAPFELCSDCAAQMRPEPRLCSRPAFSLEVRSAARYSGVSQRALLALKRHGSLSLARSFGDSLSALGLVDPSASMADALVVPPSRYRAQRDRGFSPIDLVCRQADLRVSAPFRVRPGVRDQRGLTGPERRLNMRDAFVWKTGWPDRLRGAEVLLLDDVLTTGATLAALRDALHEVDARIAGIWVLADADRR